MVSISKKSKNGITYYYLKIHTRSIEKEKYLGKKIPKDIEERKKQFEREVYYEIWDNQIKTISKNYKSENKDIEKSIKLKNFESFGIAFTYNTQKIEGSTLTEKDTKDLLIHGLTPNKKSPEDTTETKKHYELFIKLVTSKKLSKITKAELLEWHNEIFGQTKIGEAGRFRSHTVGVINNPEIEFATIPEIPKKIKEFISWLNKCEIKNPVKFSALAHYKFVSIHPFADGNGRISRLIMNYILFKFDCPLMLIKNTDRREYFKSLEKSQLKNDKLYFLKWFMRYYTKYNKKYT